MQEIDFTYFVFVIPAIILFGIAKGAAIGSLALIAIPLMLMVMPLTTALAVLLPILMIMDVIAVIKYRKNFDLDNLKIMIPAGLAGTIIAYFSFSYFTEDLLKFLIGVIGTGFTLNYFIKFNQEIIKKQTSKLKGSFWGILSGFAGFCAHSGGTPISVYLVPLRLEKTKYIGTRIIYFFALNIFKLTFYIPLKMINLENLKYTLILIPWIPVGIYIGIWLQEKCSERLFYNVIYTLIFVSSVNLLLNNYQSINFF